jgi:uracil-DNA glycosylase
MAATPDTATLAARLPELLEGVHPAWHPFFEEHGLMAAARTALERAEADADRLAPAPELVFEFLRYFGPDDALVLIMGQDPYSDSAAAQGVCFSTPSEVPLKESLKSIIGNLEAQGLARRHFRVKGDPSSGQDYCGDLRTWAAQGVVLMNAALTNRVGARGAHRGNWKAFTTAFVRALAAHVSGRGRSLICMLWGNDARAFAPAAEGATVYHWTHPSPGDPPINNRLPPVSKFENAPHFADANTALRAAGLRPVVWVPHDYTYAFTDGSCPRNGKPDAEASYAAYVLTGPLKGVEVCGRVEPLEYALVDPADPRRGFVPVAGKAATPTNNRGEYLAWCWVLLLLLRGGVRGRVEVVSDCNLFIQTMEDWLPARRKKGKASSLKNYDLVCIGEALLAALRAECGGVALTHTNSHQKRPPPEAGAQAQVFWYGNDRVDRVAGEFLANYVERGGPDFVLDAAPPLAWRVHGRYA